METATELVRGTTPIHIFTLPMDVSMVAKLRVIYAQNRDVKLIKTESDCTLTENTVQLRLTQQETLLFDVRCPAEVQLRILTPAGDALASTPIPLKVVRILQNEVIE